MRFGYCPVFNFLPFPRKDPPGADPYLPKGIKSPKIRFSVIPVKTGIQSFDGLHAVWIPAYAGKTIFYEPLILWVPGQGGAAMRLESKSLLAIFCEDADPDGAQTLANQPLPCYPTNKNSVGVSVSEEMIKEKY